MAELESRWALPDLPSAIKWCATRNKQNIRCTIDVLGEYARKERQVAALVEAYVAAANAIADHGLNASLTIKLSALGALYDRSVCSKNVQRIAQQVESSAIDLEIDMEGQGLVTYALEVATKCAKKDHQLTIALQAYLDRTGDDLKRTIASGIVTRVVKGAYVGSTSDFVEIQRRFKDLVSVLRTQKTFFAVGTHDPDLIEWTKAQMDAKRDLIEFGFLRGLADRTKVAMAREGWRVSEYVPFGEHRAAYEARRQKYLRELQNLNRKPIP
jgi:proline dehydrogenase